MHNQPAPTFAFPKLGGGTARIGDYNGRVLILYFGGLWCPDCIVDGHNTAALAALAEADPNVDFLGIHTRNRFGRWGGNQRDRSNVYDATESATALNAYFAERGYAYPLAFDASRSWSSENYAIEWYPSFLIIDHAGIIRAWRTDLMDEATARAFFAQARALVVR
jgi:thiol-disulfide isomerase/thioredoxin